MSAAYLDPWESNQPEVEQYRDITESRTLRRQSVLGREQATRRIQHKAARTSLLVESFRVARPALNHAQEASGLDAFSLGNVVRQVSPCTGLASQDSTGSCSWEEISQLLC